MKYLSLLLLLTLSPSIAFAQIAEVSDAAEAFCQCNRPSFAKMEEAMEAFGDGDVSAMMERNEELKYLLQKTETCKAGLREKYADKNEAFAYAVNSRIRHLCPRPELAGGIPVMGGVGSGAGKTDESMKEFMRSEGAPPKE